MAKLLLFFLLLPFSLFAQTFPVDAQTGKITYTEDVLVKDASRSELFDRAKAWILSAQKNCPGILQEDAAHGLLSGSKSRDLVPTAGDPKESYTLGYTVRIRVEDDWYWFSLTDFHLQLKHYSPLPPSKGTPARKQPLEALVPPKTGGGLTKKDKALAEKVAETIGVLIEEMKASLY